MAMEYIELNPIDTYEPYNPDYCKEIDCKHRHGSKCLIKKCIFSKAIRWWTKQQEK